MADHVAKAYGVIKIKRNGYGTVNVAGQRRPVTQIVLSRVTQNKPTVDADEAVVEIELTFPKGYFDQNIPKASVTFPDLPPMEVQATGTDTRPVRAKAPSPAAAVIHSNGNP